MRKTTKPVFFFPSGEPCPEPCWRPAVDIFRTQAGWLLRYDLAGVRAEDVEVWVSGRTITVTGVRRDLMLEEGLTYYSLEISYNRFKRTVELPSDLKSQTVSVEGRDGILIVRVSTEGESR